MTRTILSIVLLVVVIGGGVWLFNEMNRPRTLEERLDSATDSAGNAVDDLTADTPGEQLENRVNNAVDEAQGQ